MARKISKVDVDTERLAAFCRQHHIRKLSFFGSVLRADFGGESDVDVLVEFEQEHVPGLAFFGMKQEIGEILGRKIDLTTPGFLSRYFREEVLAEAQVLYPAA